MKRSKGYIISYTGRPEKNGAWAIGNLSFKQRGFFWLNLFPSEKWILREIKQRSPELVDVVVTNVVELSITQFNNWREL